MLLVYITQWSVYKKIIVILNAHKSLSQDSGQNCHMPNGSLQNQTVLIMNSIISHIKLVLGSKAQPDSYISRCRKGFLRFGFREH